MAFRFNKNSTFHWPVVLMVPSSKGAGKYDKQTFEAEFKYLSQERIDEIIKSARSDEINDNQVLDEVMMGWKGVQEDDGSELEFSPSNLEMVLQIPGMRSAIVSAFFESLAGARRKN